MKACSWAWRGVGPAWGHGKAKLRELVSELLAGQPTLTPVASGSMLGLAPSGKSASAACAMRSFSDYL